jgi:hypothetical protein
MISELVIGYWLAPPGQRVPKDLSRSMISELVIGYWLLVIGY